MGIVYLARDPELGRHIAIKLLAASVSEARLVREARALARLAHPNVVTVYDVGTFGGRSFVAMELLEGITVKAWLHAQPRPWREVLEVFLHAGRGLAAAHTAGLIHRDFKPENVMIARDGRVRVLDFGLASDVSTKEISAGHELPEHWEDLELTASGMMLGTPAYMSPEQLRAQETDERTDQFSFCVSLWEALYGMRPFGGRTLRELARSVMAAALPQPPRETPVPAWLHRIVARGLMVDRDARYPTMNALLAAVDAGLAEEQVAAQMIGRRYKRITRTADSDATKGERAVDRLTGKVVTVARMRDGVIPEQVEARLVLTRAFQRLAALRHPNLVGMLDFGFDREQRPYFILDLHDHSEDLLSAGRHRPVSLQIDYLLQCLRGLAYLHRRRLILGTMLPGAVLVAGSQVRIVPLGLTLGLEQASPAYTAPEVLLGQELGPSADLYALGVLAFELFAGRHPFGGGPRGVEPPDLLVLEVEPKVAELIGCLLQAEPAQRLASAEAAIAALAEASGRELPTETVETRESYLQTASLVGRDAELAQLENALGEALARRGSAWLVGGESGVGKSRLLDEVRALALIQNALVLRGQEESEGGSPYRLFRDVLRWLALLGDLDETEAGILLPIVQDLSQVLGRTIPSAPEIDPVAVHSRVCDVLERMLRRQEQPIVILLEDLQWSRSDSIKLLQSLVPLSRELPLLVLATYRNDERPALREELNSMQTLTLGRLPEQAIADLAVAIAGEAGRRPGLVELLQRETEGNAFFLVEVVRDLAEEAGGFERLGTAVLPERVFAGGVRRVVQRRLRRVPEEAQELLRIAAVVGRKIDLLVLRELAPAVDLDAWVERCLDVMVLERLGDEYRFSHDKLREGLLHDKKDAQKAALHGQVAEVIERVYPGATEQLAVLAYHYGEAGNLAKEGYYAALGGIQATRAGAFHEGIRMLERALSLSNTRSMTAIQLAGAHLELGLAKTNVQSYGEAHIHFGAALRILRCPTPGGPLFLLSQLFVHLAAWLAPKLIEAQNVRRKEELRLASDAASQISGCCFMENNQFGLISASVLAASLAMRTGDVNPLSFSHLGMMFGAIGLPKLANAYFARMSNNASHLLNRRALGQALLGWAAYALGRGDFEQHRRVLDQTRALSIAQNDPLQQSYCDDFESRRAFFFGDLMSAQWYGERALSNPGITRSSHELLFATHEALVLCWMGLTDKALILLQRCQPQVTAHDTGPAGIWCGSMAMVHAQRHEPAAALECAVKGASLIKNPLMLTVHGLPFIDGALQAHITNWREAQAQDADVREIAWRTRKCLRIARAWAMRQPVGTSVVLIRQAEVEWLEGRRDKARRTWGQALEVAQQRSFRLIEARIRLELARAAGEGSPERRKHLEVARQLFTKSGATYYLAELQAVEAASAGSAAIAD